MKNSEYESLSKERLLPFCLSVRFAESSASFLSLFWALVLFWALNLFWTVLFNVSWYQTCSTTLLKISRAFGSYDNYGCCIHFKSIYFGLQVMHIVKA